VTYRGGLRAKQGECFQLPQWLQKKKEGFAGRWLNRASARKKKGMRQSHQITARHHNQKPPTKIGGKKELTGNGLLTLAG